MDYLIEFLKKQNKGKKSKILSGPNDDGNDADDRDDAPDGNRHHEPVLPPQNNDETTGNPGIYIRNESQAVVDMGQQNTLPAVMVDDAVIDAPGW